MKQLTLLLLIFIFSGITWGQTQPQPSKKQQLTEAEKALKESQTKLTEVEARIKELTALMAQAELLKKDVEKQEQFVDNLTDEIHAEEEERAFQESPARTVVDVASFDSYLIDFNGTPRWVTLHGVKVNNAAIPLATVRIYKKKLVKKKLFVRCADADCGKVYLYDVRTNPTINALLVVNGVAFATEDALFDLVKYVPRSTPTYSPGSNAGTDVSVRGYYRKDGTYVRPHTRSSPGRRK